MKKESNIKQTKDGLVEKSSGRKIESPLDKLDKSDKKSIIIKSQSQKEWENHFKVYKRNQCYYTTNATIHT